MLVYVYKCLEFKGEQSIEANYFEYILDLQTNVHLIHWRCAKWGVACIKMIYFAFNEIYVDLTSVFAEECS